MCVTRPKFPQVRRFMLVRRKSHWRGTINTTGRCGRLDGVQGSSFRGDCAHPMLDTVSQRSFSANLLERPSFSLSLMGGKKKQKREGELAELRRDRRGVDFRHINNGRLNAPSRPFCLTNQLHPMTQPFYSDIAELNLLKFHRVYEKNFKMKLHARDNRQRYVREFKLK